MKLISPQYRARRSNQILSWLRSNTHICLTVLILVAGFFVSVVSIADRIWSLSLTMQVSGLVLSAGALIVMASENHVSTPWQAIKQWVAGVLNLFRDPPEASGAGAGTIRAPEGFSHGPASYPPNKISADERLDWLLGVVNSQYKAMGQENFKVNSKLRELEAGLQSTQKNSQQHRQEIGEKLREISVGSFYQVVLGLFLLTMGSILSLFIG